MKDKYIFKCSLLLILMLTSICYGQTEEISGRVTVDNGLPLGAGIYVKDTSNATKSYFDKNYGALLLFHQQIFEKNVNNSIKQDAAG
ncbi:hypothetical protein OOZ15_07695 [Galbibacter sp. EGI 63066]|uniref:hypothetical protein n=1 Tax=Galbibacter sp. EGI 63066 TaxID=2993559 RepID=UPI002248EB8B|nr:hypothetical protein [Galbibacter sp. EGI 63066]MCX2679816.1 hypothetical protein [Galbibacter sp. EGI 63066]